MTDEELTEELAAVDAWLDELEPGCDGWYIDVTLVRTLRDEVERLRAREAELLAIVSTTSSKLESRS